MIHGGRSIGYLLAIVRGDFLDMAEHCGNVRFSSKRLLMFVAGRNSGCILKLQCVRSVQKFAGSLPGDVRCTEMSFLTTPARTFIRKEAKGHR